MIEYRLIRSDRRTLSISIDREGAPVVRAPKRMSKKEIEAFITQKQRWIEEKQQLAKAVRMPQLAHGVKIPFWGETLTIAPGDVKKAVRADGTLWLPAGENTVQQARKWRLQQAKVLITPRVEEWAGRTGLHPSAVGFGNAKTRWGSMNHRTRSLRLNAALVHVPLHLADYVIVHELVHILHPNHSPAFHASVRAILPDADARRTELKSYGYLIRLWE